MAITAADGIELKAWFVHPRDYNGNSVILLHGITDNREGVAGYGRLLVATWLCGFASGCAPGMAKVAVFWPPMALKNLMTFIDGFHGYMPMIHRNVFTGLESLMARR